jgi:hypothetical protein
MRRPSGVRFEYRLNRPDLLEQGGEPSRHPHKPGIPAKAATAFEQDDSPCPAKSRERAAIRAAPQYRRRPHAPKRASSHD